MLRNVRQGELDFVSDDKDGGSSLMLVRPFELTSFSSSPQGNGREERNLLEAESMVTAMYVRNGRFLSLKKNRDFKEEAGSGERLGCWYLVFKCAARCIGGTRLAGGASPVEDLSGGHPAHRGGGSLVRRTGVRRLAATQQFPRCVAQASAQARRCAVGKRAG